MPHKLPNLKMLNGTEFPLFGLGVWQASDQGKLREALDAALDAGYRHIDTAQLYFNEDVIGEWLEEKIKAGKLKRSDIFITSKLPMFFHHPKHAENAINASLQRLKTDYIDLFLIHNPCCVKLGVDNPGYSIEEMQKAREKAFGAREPDLIPHIDTWRVFEKFYKEGKLKSIGVSNFGVKQVQDLYDKAEVKPMNNQFECHIYFQQNGIVDLCKKLGITVTSYSTLGSPGTTSAFKNEKDVNPLTEPFVLELAKKYHKTPAQILLRQMVQRGIAVIPKSVTPERIRENIDIFDFELTDDEQAKLKALDKNQSAFNLQFFRTHPWYADSTMGQQ